MVLNNMSEGKNNWCYTFIHTDQNKKGKFEEKLIQIFRLWQAEKLEFSRNFFQF